MRIPSCSSSPQPICCRGCCVEVCNISRSSSDEIELILRLRMLWCRCQVSGATTRFRVDSARAVTGCWIHSDGMMSLITAGYCGCAAELDAINRYEFCDLSCTCSQAPANTGKSTDLVGCSMVNAFVSSCLPQGHCGALPEAVGAGAFTVRITPSPSARGCLQSHELV